MRVQKGLIGLIVILQTVLFLAHFLVYETWTFSPAGSDIPADVVDQAGSRLFVGELCCRFPPRLSLYRCCSARVLQDCRGLVGVLNISLLRRCSLLDSFRSCAAGWSGPELPSDGGLAVRRCSIGRPLRGFQRKLDANHANDGRLANLPPTWRGRRAALISDLHLGHVRNGSFLRRMVAKILQEAPDAIFIAGDLYDGTAIDVRRAAEPLSELVAPHGVYFVAGNHEQFGDDSKYLHAIAAAGVRVLVNEKVEVDGLQIVGVPYRNAAQGDHFISVLQGIRLDRNRASILLTHAPDHPEIAEAAGVSLQLSGHTHLGQFIPWSWMARRIYRQFVYGLSRIGEMQIFTSSGAGTWGPPLRLGSNPEIVVLHFE